MATFQYNAGSFTDPLSYTLVSGTGPTCPGGDTPCTITADAQTISGVQRPVITTALSNAINTATSSSTPSATVKLKD